MESFFCYSKGGCDKKNQENYDRPTNQPTDGHEGSQESQTSNQNGRRELPAPIRKYDRQILEGITGEV